MSEETAGMIYGATLLAPSRTRFRLWAPDRESISLEIEGRTTIPMTAEPDGWHAVTVDCGAGTRYRYRIQPDLAVPDPASRAQASDVNGASVVVDPSAYVWRNTQWRGRKWPETVLYELHPGLCGGFAGITRRLPELAKLGITAVELMPIADFVGDRNWGYDGVLFYAPDSAYGTPEELKELIDTAHGLGLMMFLDVVYNHFGPEGNFIGAYASQFWRHDLKTPWGDAIDYRKEPVSRFFIDNALYWLTEYRFDGLRFDAVHAMQDPTFLKAMAEQIHGSIGPERHVHLVLENEANAADLLRETPDQPGYDAQWTDDAHHALHVLLTGEGEGYYSDYAGKPATILARCLAEGFAFQGEYSAHADKMRGQPSAHLPPTAFVIFLQNHDQIGNRAFGERLTKLVHPETLRAATALLLMAPQIPLLFMGQEWGEDAPFFYFTDHPGELAEAVREGRRREFAHFAAFADPELRERIPDPNAVETFESSRADPAKASGAPHVAWLALHRHLLALRFEHIVPHLQGARALSAEPLAQCGVHAKWRLGNGAILGIGANFGTDPLPREMSDPVLIATGRQNVDSPIAELPPRSCVVTLGKPA